MAVSGWGVDKSYMFYLCLGASLAQACHYISKKKKNPNLKKEGCTTLKIFKGHLTLVFA